jgi:hypothetical protein
MSDDRVRAQKRIFREARLAERGDYDADRGDYDADRGDYDADRGDYDADRGDYDADRGDYDADRGGAFGVGGRAGARGNRVAVDIFNRAVGLGGHLVVAFVAPIGASSPMSRSRVRPRASSVETEAAAARAHVAELIEQRKKARPITRPQQPPGSSDIRVNTQTSAYGQPIPKKEPAS